MAKAWYRQQVSSKEFKTGLKKAGLFHLRMLLGTFGKEEKEGQKVKVKINSIREEIERRGKSAREIQNRSESKI